MTDEKRDILESIDGINKEDLEQFMKEAHDIDYNIALVGYHNRTVQKLCKKINQQITELMNNSKLFEMFPQEFKDNFTNMLRSTNEIKSKLPGSEDTD